MWDLVIYPQRKIFIFDVQSCYEKMLDVSECIDELIEMQGERNV